MQNRGMIKQPDSGGKNLLKLPAAESHGQPAQDTAEQMEKSPFDSLMMQTKNNKSATFGLEPSYLYTIQNGANTTA